MAKTPTIIDKEEFQKVLSDLESKNTFPNLSALWKAVENTDWAKSRSPRPLMAASAGVKAAEMGLIIKTQPGKRFNKTDKPVVEKAKLPSASSVQMSVMDLEQKGPFSSFNELCNKLSSIHKCSDKDIRSILLTQKIITKTPKASAIQHDFIEDEDEEEVDVQEEAYTPTLVKREPEKKVEETFSWTPEKKPDLPVEDREDLSPRYKENWKKWYNQGVADKLNNKPKDLSQIPTKLPIADDLPNLEGDTPVRMWMNAYIQGYNGKKENLHCIGQVIPTDKAKGLSWHEWNIKQDKQIEGMTERF